VTTVYDVDAAWGTFQTYAMPDTIIHLTDPDNPEDTLPVSRDCDADILSEVADQMAAIGYTRMAVDTTQAAPDLALLVGVTASENWNAWVSYPWWGGWGGWGGWGWWGGYPGWGWGYPCCGSIQVSNYTTGSVVLYLFDPLQQPIEDETMPLDWMAVGNGLITASSGNCSRALNMIDQAYEQSPYLAPTTNLPN
jgi:hypothetical protein